MCYGLGLRVECGPLSGVQNGDCAALRMSHYYAMLAKSKYEKTKPYSPPYAGVTEARPE